MGVWRDWSCVRSCFGAWDCESGWKTHEQRCVHTLTHCHDLLLQYLTLILYLNHVLTVIEVGDREERWSLPAGTQKSLVCWDRQSGQRWEWMNESVNYTCESYKWMNLMTNNEWICLLFVVGECQNTAGASSRLHQCWLCHWGLDTHTHVEFSCSCWICIWRVYVYAGMYTLRVDCTPSLHTIVYDITKKVRT